MVININAPNIGENELEVTEILIQIGDNINANQPLLIVEGDKSSMEIPTPYSGTVTEIHIRIGDKIHTGSLIISLEINKTQKYFKSLNNTINIPQNNIIDSSIYKNKSKIQDNIIHDSTNTLHAESIISNNNNDTHINLIHTTPVVRRIAHKFKIDLSNVKGTGRKGRILKEDIQNYLYNSRKKIYKDSKSTPKKSNITSITDIQSKINLNQSNNIDTINLNKIQKITSSNLQKNWTTIPHVTQFDIVDITDLEIFRKKQNAEIEKKKMNYKITILVFVIKAVSKILEKFPKFNSSLSKDGETLILKKNINIGIAVDTQQGLLVPVLHDVNKKGIITLSKELLEISQKARTKNQLTPSDMQGGTFTISNLGSIGRSGTAFTPIINAPEVAILGISKSTIYPVWTGKKFVPKLMLPLSLSYDHRVINGADGIKFIHLLNKTISDIRLLSM